MKPWPTAKPRFFFMKPLQRKSGNKKATLKAAGKEAPSFILKEGALLQQKIHVTEATWI
jgi:hypothetical protein